MDETSGTARSEADHKTRRPHRKSRFGCAKCKDRRIKCDELKPRCSRCNKMNLTCQYPTRQPELSAPEDSWSDPIDPLLLQLEVSRTECGVGSPESSGHSFAIAGSPLSSASSVPSSHSRLALPMRDRTFDSPLRSQAAQTLGLAEFELFRHYLEHTSRDLTVDEEDQYTLQIGIPNLACQSKPLMRSVLAIAAVCRCCDIIGQPSVSNEDRGRVLELLSLAHRYHVESLRETQATLPEAKHYDHVLANAAMMGMYGSGSHRIRIWLAKTATFADQPLGDFMPKHSQWISLFRAVRLAYVGLLNSTLGTDDMIQLSPARSPIDPMASSSLPMQYEYKVSSRVEQPRAPTNHVLGPLLAATVGSALAQLREKARDIAMAEAGSGTGDRHASKMPAPQSSSQLQTCFAALDIFSKIVTESFPAEDPTTSTANYGHLAFEVDIDPVGQLSEVSPWLRRYTASITSMTPSKLPRRAIMAFIHKAPTQYLDLVEEMIGLVQAESPLGDERAWGSPASMVTEPSIAHQLALDIFAHWLVLVILLDNVWWIGGIGAWELGRIVSFRKDARRRAWVWNNEEDWWPESMYEVSRQLDKHRSNT